MNLERRIAELEKKASTGKEKEPLYISWEGNEGCKGRTVKNLCQYMKASSGLIWLPCGEGCEGA